MSKNTFNIFEYDDINLNNFTLSTTTSHNLINKVVSELVITKDKNVADVNICRVCGRPLRDMDSCHMGMGPICFQRYKKTLNKIKPLF
jgi:hypothetical protein